MKCPACSRELTEKTVAELTVDVCENGCGGIWFDQCELQKVDEPHEAAGEQLLDVTIDPNVQVDPHARRNCPRCNGVVMMRHYFSPKREVEIDECPVCAGFWLDHGELNHIRTLYNSEEERRAAAQQLFSETFAPRLEQDLQGDKMAIDRRRSMMGILRFLCPSYWIPGKQNWGAY